MPIEVRFFKKFLNFRGWRERDLTKALKVSSPSEIVPTIEEQVCFIKSLKQMLSEEPAVSTCGELENELSELRVVTTESGAILTEFCELFGIADPRELAASVLALQRDLHRELSAQQAQRTQGFTLPDQTGLALEIAQIEEFQTRFRTLEILVGVDWRDGIRRSLEKVQYEINEICELCKARSLSECRDRVSDFERNEKIANRTQSSHSENPTNQKQIQKVFKEMSRVLGAEFRKLNEMKSATALAVQWKDQITVLCNEFHLDPSKEAVRAFFVDAHETQKELNEFFGRIDKWFNLNEFSLKGVEIAVQRLSDVHEQFLALARLIPSHPTNAHSVIRSIQKEFERLREICRFFNVESSLSAIGEIRRFPEENDREKFERMRQKCHSLEIILRDQKKAIDSVLNRLRQEFGHQESSLREAITALESVYDETESGPRSALEIDLSHRRRQRQHSCVSSCELYTPASEVFQLHSPPLMNPDFEPLNRMKHSPILAVDTMI